MICEMCNTEHDGYYGSGRFCSSKCARQFSSKKLIKKTKIVKCITCGVEIEVDFRASDKMCKCDSCRKRTTLKQKTPKPKKFCLWCGVEVKNKFCDRKCQKYYFWSLKKNEIIEANGVGPFSIRTLKNFVIETEGHKCSICGGYEWMNEPIPLVIDHINGRASDNRLENLRLVCGNCDMQLPTFKSKNKNSDRQRLGKYL